MLWEGATVSGDSLPVALRPPVEMRRQPGPPSKGIQ